MKLTQFAFNAVVLCIIAFIIHVGVAQGMPQPCNWSAGAWFAAAIYYGTILFIAWRAAGDTTQLKHHWPRDERPRW